MITTRPIRHDLIDAAGLPGTPARCMVFAALHTLMSADSPPDHPSAIAFVAACVAITVDALDMRHGKVVGAGNIDAARAALRAVGMREISGASARTGDVMLFHPDRTDPFIAGVKIAEPQMTDYQGICAGLLAWRYPPEGGSGEDVLTPHWMRRASTAFTWGA